MTATESDEPRELPPAPADLGKRGLSLWRAIVAEYQMRPDELELLRQAVHEADLVERLNEAMRTAPLTVRGSMGQDAPHPVLMELRLHRSTLATLLKALKLPDTGGARGDGAKSWDRSLAARKASLARWHPRTDSGS